MSCISSKAAGKLQNKKKYNTIEFNDDFDIDTYEAFYRNLDPQTGRWWQIDPEVEEQESLSPYNSMANDPILKNDLLGNLPEVASGPGPKALKLGEALGKAIQVYRATQDFGKAIKQISLEDILTSFAPISTKLPTKDQLESLKNGGKSDALGSVAGQIVAGKILETHGNKLNDKPAETYSLKDKETKQVKKYGETTRGEDKFGEGNQKRYTKKELEEKNVTYNKEESGTKKDIHKRQHEKIIEYKDENGGKRPPLNKNDY